MSEKIFSNCRILIFPDGLLKKRIQLFEKQVSKYGGIVTTDFHKFSPTHILVEDDLLANPVRRRNILKSVQKLNKNPDHEIIRLTWLCRCLKEKKILSTDQFSLQNCPGFETQITEREYETPVKKCREKSSQPLEELSPSVSTIDEVVHDDISFTDTFQMNKTIVNEFQRLADAYRSRGDRWRTVAYDRAVSSLKSYSKEITGELKSLPHLSAKMLDKISEILENGFSSKAEDVCNDEKTKVLETFSKIWGTGPVTAQLWYQKGLRTLEDVAADGNLTQSQKIGLKYHNEIQETIPRQEVEEIMQVVKSVAVKTEPSVQFVPCGSFRRGKQSCGDVDVLLMLNDSLNYRSLIPKIIRELKTDGFLIDDLVGTNTSSSKYLGLCKLKGENKRARRLDLFAVPESSSACALMHYTGSALFNRGIRLHASKMNMHLSECSLKMNGSNGKILPTPTEESIFEHLGLSYRPPEERHVF